MKGYNLVNEVTTDQPYKFTKLHKLYRNYFDYTKQKLDKPLLNIIVIILVGITRTHARTHPLNTDGHCNPKIRNQTRGYLSHNQNSMWI